jgi:methionyl-tRNA synthetase
MERLGLTELNAPASAPDAPKESKPVDKPATDASDAPAKAAKPEATFDDFAKLELRVGVIVTAEKVQGKDKLLSLQVDLGEEKPRPIVAGIAQHYSADSLVGRRIVVIANLAPRKFGKGLVSHGMLLAAKHEDRLAIVTPADDLPAGSSVS